MNRFPTCLLFFLLLTHLGGCLGSPDESGGRLQAVDRAFDPEDRLPDVDKTSIATGANIWRAVANATTSTWWKQSLRLSNPSTPPMFQIDLVPVEPMGPDDLVLIVGPVFVDSSSLLPIRSRHLGADEIERSPLRSPILGLPEAHEEAQLVFGVVSSVPVDVEAWVEFGGTSWHAWPPATTHGSAFDLLATADVLSNETVELSLELNEARMIYLALGPDFGGYPAELDIALDGAHGSFDNHGERSGPHATDSWMRGFAPSAVASGTSTFQVRYSGPDPPWQAQVRAFSPEDQRFISTFTGSADHFFIFDPWVYVDPDDTYGPAS